VSFTLIKRSKIGLISEHRTLQLGSALLPLETDCSQPPFPLQQKGFSLSTRRVDQQLPQNPG
jgi:hypothetical protein